MTTASLNQETPRQLVDALPPGRLRSRCERQLRIVAGETREPFDDLIQAQADLVVMRYQLQADPSAAAELSPEIQHLEAYLRRLRSRLGAE